MKSKFLAALIMLSVLGVAQAHHSGSVYDMAKMQTWTGVLSKVEWIAPHVLVHLDVKDAAAGKVTTWTYEGPPPAWYRHAGMKRSEVEKGLGQTVQIFGAPARSGVPLALMLNIKFSDGTNFAFKFDNFDPRVKQKPPESK